MYVTFSDHKRYKYVVIKASSAGNDREVGNKCVYVCILPDEYILGVYRYQN